MSRARVSRRARRVTCLAVGAAAFVAGSAATADAPVGESAVLRYSSALGGYGAVHPGAAALGPDGALWIAAVIGPDDLPGVSPPTPYAVGVLRLQPGTRTVLSAAWLGSSLASEAAVGIAFDRTGNAYVAGNRWYVPYDPFTDSYDAPESRRSYGAFVACVRPDGTTVAWTREFGGTGRDTAAAICVTDDGDPVVVGSATSADFPLVAPVQATLAGDVDAFVTRFRADGSGIVFSTYLGGSGDDEGGAVAVSPTGTVLVAGATSSDDLATAPPILGDEWHSISSFLAELEPDGTILRRVALLGDEGRSAILADSGDSILVAGRTTTTVPFPGAPPETVRGGADLYVVRLDAATWTVRAGVRYGTSGRTEAVRSMALERGGRVWLAGEIDLVFGCGTLDLPVPGAVRPLSPPGTLPPFAYASDDGFLAAFDPTDFSVEFGTYLRAEPVAVAPTPEGGAWVVGSSDCPDFPVTGPGASEVLGYPSINMVVAHFDPGDPAARPSAPTAVAAVPDGPRAVHVRWTGDGSETGFGIDRDDGNGWSRVAHLAPGTSEWIDDAAPPDLPRTYAVQAFNDAGGSPPSDAVECSAAPTLRPLLRFGALTSPKHSRESMLRLSGRILPLDGASVPLRPARDGIYVAVFPASPDDSCHPYRLNPGTFILASDPGWWSEGRVDVWRVGRDRFRFDPRTGRFVILLRGTGLYPPANVRLEIGTDAGAARPKWRRARRGWVTR